MTKDISKENRLNESLVLLKHSNRRASSRTHKSPHVPRNRPSKFHVKLKWEYSGIDTSLPRLTMLLIPEHQQPLYWLFVGWTGPYRSQERFSITCARWRLRNGRKSKYSFIFPKRKSAGHGLLSCILYFSPSRRSDTRHVTCNCELPALKKGHHGSGLYDLGVRCSGYCAVGTFC